MNLFQIRFNTYISKVVNYTSKTIAFSAFSSLKSHICYFHRINLTCRTEQLFTWNTAWRAAEISSRDLTHPDNMIHSKLVRRGILKLLAPSPSFAAILHSLPL
ncbi:hypothetical protein Avbf_15555 [Armadillidium vulgare]|nr:hypothetical protein Avbf_15555 [Armadillidium vulgare]